MTLAVNFINTERSEAIEKIIKSMIETSFTDSSNINDVIVNIQTQSDHRVPWKCSIHVFGNDQSFNAESQAANYLTAFSQALMRVQRHWEKGSSLSMVS